MTRAALLSLLPLVFAAASACAQPSEPVPLNGASTIIVDGVRHRAPQGATHYRVDEGGDVTFLRRRDRPRRTGLSGGLEGRRDTGSFRSDAPIPAPVPLSDWKPPREEPRPDVRQPRPDVSLPLPDARQPDPDFPLGEEPGAQPTPPTRPAPDRTRPTPTPDRPSSGTRPGDGLKFMRWTPVQRRSNSRWGRNLTDIINHLPSSYGNTYADPNRMTYGHETTHGINSHLRNYLNDTGQRVNGFYLLEDRAVLVREPRMRKSSVQRYVPRSLRGPRYGTYISGSPAWDDTPTYILDEWISYTNGSIVGVELVQRGLWGEPWQDGVAGTLEFTVYSMALAQAVATHDPNTWRNEPQLRELIAWNARRAMKVFEDGRNLPDFRYAKMTDYLDAFRTSADAENLRRFIRRTYGEGFAREVFGF